MTVHSCVSGVGRPSAKPLLQIAAITCRSKQRPADWEAGAVREALTTAASSAASLAVGNGVLITDSTEAGVAQPTPIAAGSSSNNTTARSTFPLPAPGDGDAVSGFLPLPQEWKQPACVADSSWFAVGIHVEHTGVAEGTCCWDLLRVDVDVLYKRATQTVPPPPADPCAHAHWGAHSRLGRGRASTLRVCRYHTRAGRLTNLSFRLCVSLRVVFSLPAVIPRPASAGFLTAGVLLSEGRKATARRKALQADADNWTWYKEEGYVAWCVGRARLRVT